MPLNTLTVFNAALSFRLNWEGKHRDLEKQAFASLTNPQIMGTTIPEVLSKLEADTAMVNRFLAAYGRPPDAQLLLHALATFQRSLITPGSRFDRWLAGATDALTRPIEGLSLERELVIATVSGSSTPVEIRKIAQLASRYEWQ